MTTQSAELAIYRNRVLAKVPNANETDIATIFDLRNLRQKIAELKKEEEKLRKDALAIAPLYEGVLSVTQAKDSVKVDYDKVLGELAAFVPQQTIDASIIRNTQSKPGATTLKVLL